MYGEVATGGNLSRKTIGHIRQNVFFAFLDNALRVPVAESHGRLGTARSNLRRSARPDDRSGCNEPEQRVGAREFVAAMWCGVSS
jgi:hypothetical protein